MLDELEGELKFFRLGDIFKTTSGGTPSRRNPNFFKGNIPWVKSGELESNIIYKTEENISEDAIKNSSAKIFPKGTLLIALYGATIGKLALLGIEAATNQAVCGIFENKEHEIRFLYWYLFYKRAYLIKSGAGGAQPNISQSILKNLRVPLPQKDIQQKIVAKLEELFSELDKSIEGLKTAQQQLKVYRQSVLKWAFEGRLTNEEAKEGELPEGWKQVRIEEVARSFGGYAFKSGDFKERGKYQVLRMGNVRPGQIRFKESPVFLNEVEESICQKALLQLDDVIITLTGTRRKSDYGFTALITHDNLLLNQRIAAIRFTEYYSPKFFLYFSWTDKFKDQFFANETGNVGQGNVGMKAITQTLIPLPIIEEQNMIVQEIESRLSIADKVEETIENSLVQAEALRQSILKKAFEGSLE